MEFQLARQGNGPVMVTFTVAGVDVTEKVPDEALHARKELMKYCERRLHALEDKFKRQGSRTYKELDSDLNKAFEVVNSTVVEKATKQPVR